MSHETFDDLLEKFLLELCLAYDKENGSWPENKYEGEALFKFYLERFEPTDSFNLKKQYEKSLLEIWKEENPNIKTD